MSIHIHSSLPTEQRPLVEFTTIEPPRPEPIAPPEIEPQTIGRLERHIGWVVVALLVLATRFC